MKKDKLKFRFLPFAKSKLEPLHYNSNFKSCKKNFKKIINL